MNLSYWNFQENASTNNKFPVNPVRLDDSKQVKSMPYRGYQNISLKSELLVLLDEMPGKNRPDKIERLIKSTIEKRDRLSETESPEAIASHILESWSKQQKIDLILELVKSLA